MRITRDEEGNIAGVFARPQAFPTEKISEASPEYTKYLAMEKWKNDLILADIKMPRSMEDHLTDHHDGLSSNKFTQEAYDKKIKIRGEKPK